MTPSSLPKSRQTSSKPVNINWLAIGLFHPQTKMASTKHLDQPPAYTTLYGISYAISFDPDRALAEFQALSPDEKAKFAVGVAQSTSDPEVVRTLTSSDAAKAIAAIDTLFVELVSMLESLPYDKDRLVKDFEEIKQVERSFN